MKHILSLQPAYKDYIWGGERLKREYGKRSNLSNIAESWELSCNSNGHSIVENSEYAGLRLFDALHDIGTDFLGKLAEKFDFFPLLIKFIDARNNLSVQVHPNDEYALKYDNSYGKTEMWYVVNAESNSFLYYGFNKDIDKKEFAERVENNTLTEVLNKVPVKKSDVFFINTGIVHAINEGILIAEIQQNSNTTYRIYDYARKGTDGKQRQLDIQKASDVINFNKTNIPIQLTPKTESKFLLSNCEYFKVYKLNIKGQLKENSTKETFHSLLFTEGSGYIMSETGRMNFEKGKSFLIHADMEYEINGNCEALLTTL